MFDILNRPKNILTEIPGDINIRDIWVTHDDNSHLSDSIRANILRISRLYKLTKRDRLLCEADRKAALIPCIMNLLHTQANTQRDRRYQTHYCKTLNICENLFSRIRHLRNLQLQALKFRKRWHIHEFNQCLLL